MKARYIASSILAASLVLTTACVDDLDISSIDPQSDASFDQWSVFVKAYATLGLTGQTGPSGNGDLSSMDEGESGFYRTIFNCQELSTDECLWAWQSDTDIPQLTYISWNSSSQRTEWVYYRLGVNLTQYNYFLDETDGKDDEESLAQRAEVRFLRALHYAYFLDLFGKAPFKEHFNNDLPTECAGEDLFNYIISELEDCEADMADPGEADFGRADKVANWMLRARLYLNAEVYTGTAHWDDAVTYSTKAIESGYYELNTTPIEGTLLDGDGNTQSFTFSAYQQLFLADNDENANAMKEIVLPIRQDGLRTQCYSGSNYLVSGTRAAGMWCMGTTNGWTCIFARQALVRMWFDSDDDVPMPPDDAEGLSSSTDAEVYAADTEYGTRTEDLVAAAGDTRALLYSGVGGGIRGILAEDITGFTNGLSIVKWWNVRTDGASTNHDEFPDVDIPLFRLAEAYLTRAEANYNLGNTTTAMADVNILRSRAEASLITAIDETTFRDEWCREFYLEGRRRSDLIRLGLYTTADYLWDWKGGSLSGTAVDSHFNVYPIPDSDLNNNPNMTQNDGY